jgi:hypothetical protein
MAGICNRIGNASDWIYVLLIESISIVTAKAHDCRNEGHSYGARGSRLKMMTNDDIYGQLGDIVIGVMGP